jgi:hypothetical protein
MLARAAEGVAGMKRVGGLVTGAGVVGLVTGVGVVGLVTSVGVVGLTDRIMGGLGGATKRVGLVAIAEGVGWAATTAKGGG